MSHYLDICLKYGLKTLVGADLKGVDLNNTVLINVDLSGADLREVSFNRAVLSGANLEGANLSQTDLKGTDFKSADLSGANLENASLYRADLRYADLSGANLKGANLQDASFRMANLKGANLEGAFLQDACFHTANLKGANLKGADLRVAYFNHAKLKDAQLDFQIEEGLIEKVATIALEGDSLDMESWHTCDTTHCIAGWAVNLAENGSELEEKYGTEVAGLLLLGIEAHSHFFDDDEEAKLYLNSVLEKST